MNQPSTLFIVGAVFQLLILLSGITLAFEFFKLRNQFPVNHRRPHLTLCSFASVALYAILYFIQAAAPETCPCWIVMMVNGLSMSAYNIILLRTWILWFKHKLTLQYATEDAALTIQRRPTASVAQWYLRNKYLIQDKYLAM
jgi:CDP-diglyceride synthetase